MARPGPPGLPPGYIPAGPGRKPFKVKDRPPEEARDIIKSKFEKAEKTLHGMFPFRVYPPFSTEILDFVKADKSVTVDFRVMNINPRLKIDDILMALHEKLDRTGVSGAWLSVGFYNPPDTAIETEEGYKRVQGQIFYRTYARRWRKKLSVLILEQARWSQERFMALHNRRPVGIVVRAWWNPFGSRPLFKKQEKKK